jgi:citrate lyase subunit beta/citryl-CoA lyase
MRSLLFVPGDKPRMLDKAIAAGADGLILDLEDSVAPARKAAARATVASFLSERRKVAPRPQLFVRINALSSPFCEGDLDAVMTSGPDGVVLPKACGGADVALLGSRLTVREALHGLADGETGIIAIATETAASLFAAGSYAGASRRLRGLAWGAEDLAADVGALAVRDGDAWTPPFELARNLCLFSAAAAGVAAIDTVHTNFRDPEGLRRRCETAARDGFAGKLAIHPAQVAAINEAFTPSPAAISRAEAVVAAFAAAGGAGVISLDGAMLDRPHLTAAERLLGRARRGDSPGG